MCPPCGNGKHEKQIKTMARKKTPQRLPLWERTLEKIVSSFKRLLIPALAIWLIGWLWLGGVFQSTQSMIWNGFVDWTANQGYVVKDVIIEGRNKTNMATLKSLIDIKPSDPLLSVDIDKIQSSVQNLEWVKSVSIARYHTGIITVKIIERMPFVIWDRPGRAKAVLDRDGHIINNVNANTYTSLLIMSGVNAKSHIVDLLNFLIAEPAIKNSIHSVQWIGDRRWDLITHTKTRIMLPQNDIGFALARLAKTQNDSQILNQGYKSIDLRANDRVIVETYRGKVQDIMGSSRPKNINII